jgi:hypothetical protein
VLAMTTQLNNPDLSGIHPRHRKPLTPKALLVPWPSIRALDGSWKARRNAQAALQRSADDRAEQRVAIDRFEHAHAKQPLVDLLAMTRGEH